MLIVFSITYGICYFLLRLTYLVYFLLRDADMHSAYLLSQRAVCPSRAGIVAKRLKISPNIFSALYL